MRSSRNIYIEPEVDPIQQVLDEDFSLIYWACRKETNLITSDKSKETRVSQPITSQSPVLRVRDIRDMTKNIFIGIIPRTSRTCIPHAISKDTSF